MRPDGTRRRRLTRYLGNGGSGFGWPTVALGRDRLSVVRSRNDDAALDVYSLRRNGSRQRRVYKSPRPSGPTDFATNAAIAPNASWIVYTRDEASMWRVKPSGHARRKILEYRVKGRRGSTYDKYLIRDPNVSPNGGAIAFVHADTSASAPEEEGALALVDATGKNTRLLTNQFYNSAHEQPPTDKPLTSEVVAPRFSPDGTKIVFGCSIPPKLTASRLCVINVDGSGFHVVVPNAGRLSHGGTYNRSLPTAAWSPTGDRFVFSCGREMRHLCVVNADGSGRRTIGSGFSPTWG